MSVFQCECGDTIKKSKMIKHTSTCWGTYQSCIDCLLVFSGKEEWRTHPTCKSEAEKVMGSMYKAPKPGSMHGKAKQDAWIDNVHSLLNNPESGISPRLRPYLTRLVEFDNIPRKEAKFLNFTSNSLNLKSPGLVKEIWDLFASCAKPKGEKPQQQKKDADNQESWSGWRQEIDSTLQEAGGTLPWRALQTKVAKKRVRTKGTSMEDAKRQCLLAIPPAYLSDKATTVKLA
mmetsp:Transcript_30946/g.67923  ORF Transcript_30946/g.67923 Transcript_30946/m.67923 type:complete len:231 (+) Transcript_30946:98-790(+)